MTDGFKIKGEDNTKPNTNALTLLGLVLDESGSMAIVRDDTIGSVNTYFEELRKDPSPLRVTLTQFNTKAEITRPAVPLVEFPEFTKDNYRPDGLTALNDAIGITVNKLEEQLKDNPGAKALLVVVTDGQENSSLEFSREQIRQLIQNKEKEDNWTFVFLSADPSAFTEAKGYGFGAGNYAQYDKRQGKKFFAAVAQSTNMVRSSGETKLDNFVLGNAEAFEQAGTKLDTDDEDK